MAVDRILACNVAGAAGRRAIETLADALSVTVEWVCSQASQGDVTNGYEVPAQLGADRWAALIGARALHRGPALVVMSGTATTVDVLDREGRFHGGLILPGLALMREALAARTADLPAVSGEYRELPRNTFDAIASGCLQATAGAIERLFRPFFGEPDALCLLSGGAAPTLVPHLALPLRTVDNLVLEGLARIAAGD
jgi:type III pantothenate kinase